MAMCFYCRWPLVLRQVALLGCVLSASAALAVLGKDVSSIDADRASSHAQLRIAPGPQYSVHELRAATGTIIREFVSPRGEVFAVAWQGPAAPDLRQLLGDYFDTYVRAAQAAPSARRGGEYVDAGDLVVESGGHMRFLTGRAYLRSKLPGGVDLNAIH